MADNINVLDDPHLGTVPVATDEIGGVHYPVYKMAYGADGSQTPVSSAEPLPVSDYFHKVAEGEVTGHSFVHKFGKNKAVGTNYSPISIGGVYQTPQADAPVNLRIKAGGNVNDAQNGTGARSVFVQGITTDGSSITEILLPHATDGTLVGVNGSVDFIRIYRAYVSSVGTYANASFGAHLAPITIEDTGGVADWLTIDGTLAAANFPRGQSQIGVYTVPLGHTAFVYNYLLTTDGNKTVDFIMFKREAILETSAPYTGAMRCVVEEVGVQGELNGQFQGGQRFPELTDVGWMAKGASTPIVTVDFEIMLVAD